MIVPQVKVVQGIAECVRSPIYCSWLCSITAIAQPLQLFNACQCFRCFASFLVLSGAVVVAVTEQEQGWGASCCLACLLMVASVGSVGGWVASPVLFRLVVRLVVVQWPCMAVRRAVCRSAELLCY